MEWMRHGRGQDGVSRQQLALAATRKQLRPVLTIALCVEGVGGAGEGSLAIRQARTAGARIDKPAGWVQELGPCTVSSARRGSTASARMHDDDDEVI